MKDHISCLVSVLNDKLTPLAFDKMKALSLLSYAESNKKNFSVLSLFIIFQMGSRKHLEEPYTATMGS